MAIYHCSIKNIGRSSGRSAVACASYRSSTKLYDEELGKSFDYTSKHNVVYSEIFLCENAPREYQDRETLWNAVEKIEKQGNARFAREIEVAIPNELDFESAKELIQGYSKSLADEGMCVDSSIHWKDGNHHAHIMATTRPIKENGAWGQKEKKVFRLDEDGNKIPQLDNDKVKEWEKAHGVKFELEKASAEDRAEVQKVRVRKGKGEEKLWQRETVEANDWNKKEKLTEWRQRWAEQCNQYLDQEHQIDHRSYEEQGVEKVPKIHEGYAAREMEKRGQVSELCEVNRMIDRFNDDYKDSKNIFRHLKNSSERANIELKRLILDKLETRLESAFMKLQLRKSEEDLRKAEEDRKKSEEDLKKTEESLKSSRESLLKDEPRESMADLWKRAYKASQDVTEPYITLDECERLENYIRSDDYDKEFYKPLRDQRANNEREIKDIQKSIKIGEGISKTEHYISELDTHIQYTKNYIESEEKRGFFKKNKKAIQESREKIRTYESQIAKFEDELALLKADPDYLPVSEREIARGRMCDLYNENRDITEKIDKLSNQESHIKKYLNEIRAVGPEQAQESLKTSVEETHRVIESHGLHL